MHDFDYFSLVRKVDDKEVYSSPKYLREGSSEVLDMEKVQKTLNFYFERVNSGIEQQLNNPKITEEQKKNLKLLEKCDYLVKFVNYKTGRCFQKCYWTNEASDFLKS